MIPIPLLLLYLFNPQPGPGHGLPTAQTPLAMILPCLLIGALTLLVGFDTSGREA